MILNRIGATFSFDGVTYTIGDRIVGTDESEYEGLFGTILEIRTGEDKETDNDTPDFHCEFLTPVLPAEVKELEARFSDLYRQKKTIADIALDEVIMAPEMIRVISTSSSHTATIYLVREQWALDGDNGESVFPALDPIHAKLLFTERIRSDKEEGCISRWSDRGDMEEESTKTSYECWLHDDYFDNHFKVTMEEHALQLSHDSFTIIGKAYVDSRLRSDFAEQIEGWEELSVLTDGQIGTMIAQPSVPERIRKQLQENRYMEESYWESVSEAAFSIVDAFVKQIGAGGAK